MLSMRFVTMVAVASLLTPSVVPAAAIAQAVGRGVGPADACNMAIRYEVQNRYPQARHIRFDSPDIRDSSRNQARVSGRAEFEDRNGGDAKFDYGCTYHYRSGRTSDLSIDNVRHKDGKNNNAAVAGLVLGAIVIGALAANASKDKDKDKDDWRHDEVWSPSNGVRCVARERACYKDGRYSQKWTDRTFYR